MNGGCHAASSLVQRQHFMDDRETAVFRPQDRAMTKTAPSRLFAAAAALIAANASAMAASVDYTISMAGIPVGSASFSVRPAGGSATVAVSGRVGGALELGRFDARATVSPGNVTAESNSGSGKDAASASLASRGSGASRSFSYQGKTSRGPGQLSMTVAGGQVTALTANIPDNPNAVRVPVTDAHKSGVVDPLAVVAALVKPSGALDAEAICGRQHRVFTGQVRFDLAGSAARPASTPSGAPAGWAARTCKVAYTPVSGHRIDKGQRAQARTATLVFVEAPDRSAAALWSLSVPSGFGSFSLTASGVR
jgi:hypothetical protein